MANNDLWDYYGGEPMMQNPHLGILNPRRTRRKNRRGSTTMARTARRGRGRRRSHSRSGRRRTYSRGRRRTYQARRPTTRRTYRRNPRRRRHSYRRNPSLLGLQLPGLNTFLFTGLGFASAPVVEGFASQFLPAQLTSNVVGRYVLKFASIAATAWATKQFVGRTEARNVLIGGGVYIFTNLMVEFAPGVIPGLGAYTPTANVAGYTPYRNMGHYTSYRNLGYAGAGVPVTPAASPAAAGAGNVTSMSRFSRPA